MPERSSFAPGTPSWVDLSTTDPDAARDFYGPLLGWEYVIDPSEETGHYATATVGGKNVAGVNGMSITEQPPAWTTYFELNTRDLAAAIAFYTAILPVTAHDMSDGDFHYQTLQVEGADVAGMWEMSADVAPDVPPNWGVYFTVADADASVTQATSLGASVIVPVKDSPYGRLAGLRDP